MTYCVDASSFIEAWTRSYPIDVFPDIWTRLEKLTGADEIITCKEVVLELRRQDDGLAKWIESRGPCVRDLTSEIQGEVSRILMKFPNLIQPGSTKNQADPFVIATAIVEKRVVVSQEAPSYKPNKPKIPDVCAALQVEHINLLTMIRRIGRG